MKTVPFRAPFWSLLSAALLGLSLCGRQHFAAVSGTPPNSGPLITGIRLEGANVLITASVSAGIKKVTLQSARRLGTGAWEPRAVARLDGRGGEVTFNLPQSLDLEIVRVRGDDAEVLPSSFYQGTNAFAGVPVSVSAAPPAAFVDAVGNDAEGRTVTGGPTASRDVVESDIWQLDGDTLYFFNQYRGLQVIDVSNPDAPVLRGNLALPAAGEQMYLLPDHQVALLVRSGCSWTPEMGSQVLIVAADGPGPAIVATLPVSGEIRESRLVGSALYVMTQTYRPVPNSKDGAWEWGTGVYSFDLSNPAAAAERSTLWYPGYGNVLTATDRYLFVDITEKSEVHVIDISAPDGTMSKQSAIRVLGRVTDKFKMNLDGDVFTVIAEEWSTDSQNGRWRPVTRLQTFSLANPAAPRKLGELELGKGEQLHATRFDGKRLYVVTFFQVDPLWVVDLSDPSHPAIVGELEVPGWSTYIQPLGDRLVSIGIDNTNGWRVAVSLFDVHDPTAPSLISKVPLGENSSWSEANADEKAFGFLPDDGLILVPVTSYSTNLQQGVQLIDFRRDSLVKRGFITHDIEARRSTLHRDRILSISGRELLAVNAADRDHPEVSAELELAWPVNRVFVQDGYLIELETSAGWGEGATPNLRVVASGQPQQVLNALSLTNLPVVGATYRDGRLYVLQGLTSWIPLPLVGDATGAAEGTNQTVLVCSVIDVSKLPALQVIGTTDTVTGEPFYGSAADAVWPKNDVLVWVTQQTYYWRGWLPMVDVVFGGFAGMPLRGAIDFWYPYGRSGDAKLYAVNVATPSAPDFVSEVSLAVTNGWANFSKAYGADKSVFLSRQLTETLITGTNYVVWTNVEHVLATNVVMVTNHTRVPEYHYETNAVVMTDVVTASVANRLGDQSVLIPGLTAGPAQVIGGGTLHSIALSADGRVWTWGDNGRGQLGDSTYTATLQPKAIAGLGQVRAIASGDFHNLALATDGSLWAWGDDTFGQLGDGLSVSDPSLPPMPEQGTSKPVQVRGPANLVAVGAGSWHSLAVQADGSLWTWGANAAGQLGNGTTDDQLQPVRVADLTDVIQVAGGHEHSVALKRDGTVWTWGDNAVGQLGDGSKIGRNRPGQIAALAEVMAVAAGRSHTVALKRDGTVWTWGSNESGQLGDGSLNSRLAPGQVSALDQVVAIACGERHSLALRKDGTVWAWGLNKDGQLNGVPSVEALKPVLAEHLPSSVLVGAGGKHSLAVNAQKDLVYAWGINDFGQLGNGSRLTVTNSWVQTNYLEQVVWVDVTEPVLRTNVVKMPQNVTITNAQPIYTSRQLSSLLVVDYAAPANPVVRQPVSIPGALQGLSANGALLYLVGYKMDADGVTDGSEWLYACAYDGVSAFLVDSHALPTEWPHPLLVVEPQVYIARPQSEKTGDRGLEVWTLTSAGKFSKLNERKLAANASLFGIVRDMLVAQEDTGLELFNLNSPIDLPLVGSGGPQGCVGWSIEAADGSVRDGLWLPLDLYGVYQIPATR
ncbi:MAG: beta-propeller domain-containing protein [Verrucomicrobiota bacterium]